MRIPFRHFIRRDSETCMKAAQIRTARHEPGRKIRQGIGQLSLVEHALCPLDARRNSNAPLLHESVYHFTDRSGHRRKARVRVTCPLGLTPVDEFYLWGLLALTLSQPKPTAEFHATPHYCLRQLGVIDQHTRRGGRQYEQFAKSLERLSAVTYQSDGFYDPIRREHCRVAFGFLSYGLPLLDDSSRAWRIHWDTLFFKMASALGGHLRFDLEVFRQLDPASRRMFLFLGKLFRREQTHRLDLRYVGVQVLGFAASLANRDLKVKVSRCIRRLIEVGVIANSTNSNPAINRRADGGTTVHLQRGDYFSRKHGQGRRNAVVESPLAELMRTMGLDEAAVVRMLKRFPTGLLQQWLDITLAARERFGAKFFRKSAAAYFVDNVQKAAQGTRTPPDWWNELHRHERRVAANCDAKRGNQDSTVSSIENLTDVVFRQFTAAGQSDSVARENASRFVDACKRRKKTADIPRLLKLLA
jgi:hypothetical protein